MYTRKLFYMYCYLNKTVTIKYVNKKQISHQVDAYFNNIHVHVHVKNQNCK